MIFNLPYHSPSFFSLSSSRTGGLAPGSDTIVSDGCSYEYGSSGQVLTSSVP